MDQTPNQAAAKVLSHARKFAGQRTIGNRAHQPIYAPLASRPAFQRRRLATLLGRLQSLSRELGHPLRVLDLACGGGVITCAASLLGHRTLGLDMNPDQIHWAKLFAQEQGSDGLFWRSDLIHDPFWEQTAGETLGGRPNAVILADALGRLPPTHGVEFFVDRLSRWLGSGTMLLVSERNPASPLTRFRRFRSATPVGRNFEEWRQLLEARGFEVDAPSWIDELPWLERVKPTWCSSLVFTARRR